MTGLKLPFLGLSFVEFWCWGLIFGGQGGAEPPGPPPGSAPGLLSNNVPSLKYYFEHVVERERVVLVEAGDT